MTLRDVAKQSVKEVSVISELDLTGCAVASSHWLATSVARCIEVILVAREFTAQGVEHVELGSVSADGSEQPRDGAVYFFVQSKVEQRIKRE